MSEDQKPRSQTTPTIRWRVYEDGKVVHLEIICRDAYEAIELTDHIANGIRNGDLTLELQK